MAKAMKTLAALCTAAALILRLLWGWRPSSMAASAAITASAFAYHLLMRLAVGGLYDLLLHNRVDHRLRWFRPRFFEAALYRLLKVKRWKKFMPTYDPDTFSPQLHSWEEIIQATCQSELVHETIMVLSFVPLAAVKYFGSAGVFLITSAAAALFDSLFVMMQRFNRFRLLKTLEQRAMRQPH